MQTAKPKFEMMEAVTRNPRSAVMMIMSNPDPISHLEVFVQTGLLALPEVRPAVRRRALADLVSGR